MDKEKIETTIDLMIIYAKTCLEKDVDEKFFVEKLKRLKTEINK